VSARPEDDRFAAARAVADAVLYEGYVLYPYRASATKNQLRWQFGVLVPRACSEIDGSERWSMRTECIMDPGTAPTLSVRIRCLQVQHRSVESAVAGGSRFFETDRLDVDGVVHVPWDEAVEHVIDIPMLPLLPLTSAAHEQSFRLPAGADIETVRHDGRVVGRVVRRREAVDGCVRVGAEHGPDPLVKIVVVVENTTDWSGDRAPRDEVVSRSLVAVHTMLAIDDGVFVSLLDPPVGARASVAGCVNDGTFPVLIGSGDVVLSSPIILYDQPQVAPESPGDLYDATEIDEILALRVLTLTDDEKAEARGTDPRAAAIIDRCDDMPPELWARLHGAIRSVQPAAAEAETECEPETEVETVPWWDPGADQAVDPFADSVVIAGVDVRRGTTVRLRPSRRADAHDLFFDGLAATVTGIFRDVDGNEHVAVTIDDDPATEALEWQRRYLYFHPDEVVPLGAEGEP
jgi:hypothetical protein